MSASWAVPGAKCVCVEGDWPEASAEDGIVPVRVPMLNEVLTVCYVEQKYSSLYLFFNEIPAGGWNARCFRPLITRTQSDDVSLFVPLLTRVGEPA